MSTPYQSCLPSIVPKIMATSTAASAVARVGVVGLGVDLAHQPRLLRAYSKFGDRFLARAFHPREAQRVRELAGRGMGDVTRQQVGDFLASR